MTINNERFEQISEFLKIVNNLNYVFRYSEHSELKNTQNTASHSWRLALMSFLIAKELNLKIDVEKSIKFALIHDIAESITGDIDYSKIYTNKISLDKKNEDEKKAVIKLNSLLPKELGDEFVGLWNKYEQKDCDESRFIYALDKIESLIYFCESAKNCIDYPDMIAKYADKGVSNFPELKPFLKNAKRKLRFIFEKNNIPWKKEYDEV